MGKENNIKYFIRRERQKMYFEWKDGYSVNIAEIDKQHKKLFEIGGRISDLVLSKDEYDQYDEIISILQELKDYTIYHFEYEEKLMSRYGYAELDGHRFEHMFLTKKIKKFENVEIDADQKAAIVEIIAFVSDWIAGHILKTDLKYREFFNQKGIR